MKPQKKLPKIGVATFVINDKNQILLGNRINSHGHDTWGLPGGKLDFMETIEDCSAREAFEETNLVVEKVEILNITNDFFHEEDKHFLTVFTIAKNFTGELQVKEPEKCKCWEWFDLENLPENLFQPLATFLEMHGLEI